MKKTENNTNVEIQEFEVMAERLLHKMFCICKGRTHNLPYVVQSPEKTLTSAAMTVKEAIRTFIEATRL